MLRFRSFYLSDLEQGFEPGSSVSTVPYCVLNFSSCFLTGIKYSSGHGLRKAKQLLHKWMMDNKCLSFKWKPNFSKILKSVVVEGHKLTTGVINIFYNICAVIGDARIL